MLRSLIAFCLSRRLLVMVAFAAFLGLGYVAFLTLNIEAYPDPAPPIIEIIAQQAASRRRKSSVTSRFRSRSRSPARRA